MSSDYETIGILKNSLTISRNPVAVIISKSKKTGDISFQFGIFQNGRIKDVRYWRRDRFLQMSVLVKICAQMEALSAISGIDLDGKRIKDIVDKVSYIELVEEYIPEKKKMSMTLGDRAIKR